MLLVTSDLVPGREIAQTLGLVRGSTVRAKHIGSDIVASLRNVVGGEVKEYAQLLAGSREQAIDRMVEEAAGLGADAIIAVRITTSSVTAQASEVLAYGTAVRLAE
ncbi:MAG: YbjQ family protein [Pseudomonadota bacterium]